MDHPRRKIIWVNLLFFTLTAAGSIASIAYFFTHGISYFGAALFFAYVILTGMSITVGYHRLFSHRSFRAHPVVRFLALFFGAAAFEQSALDWSSQHRDHHRYVDTLQDPYNIRRGFFYAHIGWLLFWKHTIDHENAKDLLADRLVMAQHRRYHLWAIGAGILLPLALGALAGHLAEAALFAVVARLALVHHATFCINSVCHMFGKPTYDPKASARDHWLVAFLTNGEGYHSFHHRFPVDYRNGIRWYHWDPSKWLIRSLAWLGLVWDLKKTDAGRILQARLVASVTPVTDKRPSAVL